MTLHTNKPDDKACRRDLKTPLAPPNAHPVLELISGHSSVDWGPCGEGSDRGNCDGCPKYGLRGLYHAAYVEDYGSTAPDPYCQLVDRRTERDGNQHEPIAVLSIDEVDQLIALLQEAGKTMLDLCEFQVGAS